MTQSQRIDDMTEQAPVTEVTTAKFAKPITPQAIICLVNCPPVIIGIGTGTGGGGGVVEPSVTPW